MFEARLNTGLESLDEPECQALLGGEEFGRIAVIFRGRPEIFPVNYTLDRAGCVVFRTAEGTKLAAAINQPVTFEVDRIVSATKSGWSVIVHGIAEHAHATSPGGRPLAPWLYDKPYMIRITRESITGRRLVPGI